MTNVRHNEPGAPTNTPQHPGDQGDPDNRLPGQGAGNAAPPGPNEGPQGLDPADPHPAEEGDPYDARHPRAKPPTENIGPNPAAQKGTAPPRPHSAGNGAE
jgi:hypothetical protein